MTGRSEARERLMEAARSAGVDPKEFLAILDAPSAAAPDEPETPPSSNLPPSDAAIRAAICDTFTYEELVDAEADRSVPDEEIAGVLAQAVPVVLGGQRRLRLFPEARREILARSRETDRYRQILETAQRPETGKAPGPAQRQTDWLRRFLSGTAEPLESLDLADLSAAAAALDALDGILIGETVPAASEARRLLDLAQLVEPLKILIGASDLRAKGGGPDRFVGRSEDLAKLRAYVDELDSETRLERVQRSLGRVASLAAQTFYGHSAGPYVIEARGGLGKSTLIAKFVHDHALGQGAHQRFAFAYLDFDRAGLQTDGSQLLNELARQVGLQFPQIEPALAEIRSGLAQGLGPDITPFHQHLDRFRELVRQVAEGRSFLLVLDTMEVVQYNPLWLQAVVDFIKGLHGSHFPELRVVAAGRADIPELREETSFWSRGTLRTLAPLGVREAKDMVSRLGMDLMGDAWNDAWAVKIAGGSAQPANRREPLSLRVAVELMRSIEGASERGKFADEIAETGDTHESFVGKLYQRRILDHVRDPEVRKLAWPGLVLRTITPSLIRSVLAGPCELDLATIDDVFDALGREVWIVRREGLALRHRPDLRARTLPLMRKKDRDRFDRINRAAIEHFAADHTPEGRAEWIYHRLLDGQDPAEVDKDWDDKLAVPLAGAADDFHADFPRAAAYILARTSARLLPAARLAELPAGLAFEHVARAARRLAKLDDVRASPTVLDLAVRANPEIEPSLAPDAEAAKQAILIKSGRWRAPALEYGAGNRDGSPHYDFGWSFYAVRAGLAGNQGLGAILSAQEDLIQDFVAKPKPAPIRARIQDLARFRLEHRDWEDLDRAIAEALDVPGVGPSSPSDIASWRLCAVIGETSARGAVRQWLHASARREVNSLSQAVAEAELVALAGCGDWTAFREILGSQLHSLDFSPEQFREQAAKGLDWDLEMRPLRARFDIPELARAVHRLVAALNENPDLRDRAALRAFFAARSEDWIVPLGYTLLRRHQGAEAPAEVLELLEKKERTGWFSSLSGRRSPRLADPLVLLRRADEGAQLGLVLDRYRNVPGDASAEKDFQYLADLYLRWRNFIGACVQGEGLLT